jgi:hypothetical protein
MIRVANVLLNLEPLLDVSLVEKLSQKKRCENRKSIGCFKILGIKASMVGTHYWS